MGIEEKLGVEEIRIYEGFKECNGCVFCTLIDKYENKILSNISQDLVMDLEFFPKFGLEYTFCDEHIAKFDIAKDKLGMAIMLKKLVSIQKERINNKQVLNKKISLIKTRKQKCFICEKVKSEAILIDLEIALNLWRSNEKFRELYKKQKMFCFEHFELLLQLAKKMLNRNEYKALETNTMEIQKRYYTQLDDDIAWFINKFDYRYNEKPWYNSKDAIERAKKVLKRLYFL